MDPISAAILAAVVKLTEPAVKDAYEGLKAVIARKFGRDHKVAKAIDEVESNPTSEGRKAVLAEEVSSANPGADAEVLAALRALMTRLSESPSSGGSVNAIASGANSVAVGGSVSGSTIRTGNETSGDRSGQ